MGRMCIGADVGVVWWGSAMTTDWLVNTLNYWLGRWENGHRPRCWPIAVGQCKYWMVCGNLELFIGPMGQMLIGANVVGPVRCVSVWQDVCCCAALSQNVFGAVRGHIFDSYWIAWWILVVIGKNLDLHWMCSCTCECNPCCYGLLWYCRKLFKNVPSLRRHLSTRHQFISDRFMTYLADG